MNQEKKNELLSFAADIRTQIIYMISKVGSGHVGGSLSIADLMACLYGGQMNIDPADPRMEERDRIVLSKGHAGPAMYAALALRGYFPMAMLDTLNQPPTNLPSHTDRNRTPGVDMTTGSLGQGASTFGWNVIEVADGNDVEAIWAAIDKAKIGLTEMPTIIVLHTVKGKGWSKAECQESCHSMSVTVEQARQAALEFAQQKR